jgi:hypothetical protein
MNNRTQQLESIRLPIDIDIQKSSVWEVFQSKTLRPILKFQNEIIVALFRNYLLENKIKIAELNKDKKEVLIHAVLKKNSVLKNTLIGLIVGHFTAEELLFYLEHKSEVYKRMVELLIKRISDQTEKL